MIQLTLAKEMLNSEGGQLDIKAACMTDVTRLPSQKNIPWQNWDIVGRPS